MENLIRSERAQRGWTQATLAEYLEVSRQTIVALEAGKYDPSLPLAFRISDLFGRPIEAIFFPTRKTTKRAGRNTVRESDSVPIADARP